LPAETRREKEKNEGIKEDHGTADKLETTAGWFTRRQNNLNLAFDKGTVLS